LWALKDVSLQVQSGEVLGLIGPNGAGKTTALSLLAGIISPTSGQIAVRGRIGALIKLGAGFHPDLTGRENVYLNGSILGLGRVEIDSLYNDIVQFAELEKFMDTPVKRFSSGMYVRLGFAVAVHIEPEILLVDEILSVGDVSFQSRCLNRIGEIREAGTTVVFVSHNMHHVASFCDRVIYLRDGQIQTEGESSEVLSAYTNDVMNKRAGEVAEDGSSFDQVYGSGKMVIESVSFLNGEGVEVDSIRWGEALTLRVHYTAVEAIENPILDVVMRDASRGNMYQATNRDFGVEFGAMGERGHIDVHFESIQSNNQVLDFFLALWNSNYTEKLDWKRFIKLRVDGLPTSSGRILYETTWERVVHVKNPSQLSSKTG
jgi:ABC-type polysaccharide/polyol phosphate transport system ATPase subunit